MIDRAGPLWNWDGLASEELEARWRDLALWVEWLQRSYGQWVRLPPCWADHLELRAELLAFRHWHHHVYTAGAGPAEVVSWHQQLRQAAAVWEEMATCEHQSPMSYEVREAENRAAAVEEHVQRAKRQPFLDLPPEIRPPGADGG